MLWPDLSRPGYRAFVVDEKNVAQPGNSKATWPRSVPRKVARKPTWCFASTPHAR